MSIDYLSFKLFYAMRYKSDAEEFRCPLQPRFLWCGKAISVDRYGSPFQDQRCHPMRFVAYQSKLWSTMVLAVVSVFAAIFFLTIRHSAHFPFFFLVIIGILLVAALAATLFQFRKSSPVISADEKGLTCYKLVYGTFAWSDIKASRRIDRVERISCGGQVEYNWSFTDAWRPIDVYVRNIQKYSKFPAGLNDLTGVPDPGGEYPGTLRLRLNLTGTTGSSEQLQSVIQHYIHANGFEQQPLQPAQADRAAKSPGSRILARVSQFLAFGIGLAILIFAIANCVTNLTETSWIKTTGKVLSTQRRSVQVTDDYQPAVQIPTYSFNAAHGTWTNTVYPFRSLSYAEVREFQGLRPGMPLTVFYNPDDPSKSTPFELKLRSALFLAGFGLLATIIPLVILLRIPK